MTDPDTRHPNPVAPPRRILLVRPSALGDVARTVPVAVSLKQAFPDARLEWVVNRPFVDAVTAHPAVDEVIPFDRDRPGKVWALMRGLRRRRYDAVYDLQGLARSGLLTWATRAKRRVGFSDARELGWLGYNVRHLVRGPQINDEGKSSLGRTAGMFGMGAGFHTVGRMLSLLAADGLEPVADLRLYARSDDSAWAESWRTEHSLPSGGYVVLAPTAQWGCKCWPVERYAALAESLLREERTARVVMACSPSERDGVREGFKEALLEASRGFGGGEVWSKVLWPDTTVGQLMAVLASSKLVVCNDSAALHLAVGLGVPTVSIFGPTDPALVGPWGYELVHGPQPQAPWGKADGGSASAPGGRHHLVLRAADAADGARDYRKHRDDDTLIRQVELGPVAAAVARQLG